MGDGSVKDGAKSSWRLSPEQACLAQGILVSGFGKLPIAGALFLELPAGGGGEWLRALRGTVPITTAEGEVEPAAAIAFTCTGLRVMGMPNDAMATFSTPFREGMHEANRQRRLGDHPEADLVIPGGPLWSGNTPVDHPDGRSAPDRPTEVTVHAVVFLYEPDDAALDVAIARLRPVLDVHQVRVAHLLRLCLREDPVKGVAREHFGFADGLSQPVPMGDTIAIKGGPHTDEELRLHGVAAGEIFIGHINAHGEEAPGPLVKEGSPGARILPRAKTRSRDKGLRELEGFRDLGTNGSYMVVRQLKQDVAAFWNSLHREAEAIADSRIDAQWLAERIVGRTCDGAPLAPSGPLPNRGKQPENLFGYASDPHGLGCPLGSHVRRGNPRDSLPSRDGNRTRENDGDTLLRAANNHRILRRGRKYGPDIEDPRQDDGQDRGLLFVCLNTDIVRHFEFVQQTWMLNQGFATLFQESDPLLGPKGAFTIPVAPVRRRPLLETYVKLVGGEYFFVPSIPALDYLSALPARQP